MSGRVVILASALAFGAFAAGCGRSEPDSSGKFKGEEKLVANAIEDLQDAGRKGDATRICRDLLARDVVRTISKAGDKTCAQRVKDSLDDADVFDLSVKSVTVKGATATATVTSDDGNEKDRVDTMTLAKEGKRWKIAALGS